MHSYIAIKQLQSCTYCKFIFRASIQSFKALLKTYLLMSTAELKILITFLYYMFCLGSVLAISSVGTVGPRFTNELLRYFSCEATGIMPGKVCERRFQRLEIEIPVNLVLVLLGLYPAVNLVYILNLTKTKRWISRQCTCNHMNKTVTSKIWLSCNLIL